MWGILPQAATETWEFHRQLGLRVVSGSLVMSRFLKQLQITAAEGAKILVS